MTNPYYSDDWVTLYHGDCQETMPTIGPVDAVITDPPYGVGFKYHGAYTDEGGDVYARFIADVQSEITDMAPVQIVTPGIANIWLWKPATWVICWHKPGAPGRTQLHQPLRPQGGFNEWEPVLVYGRPRFMSDVIRIPAPPQAAAVGHPCPKPLSLLHLLVNGVTKSGDTVFDPFAGSGSTLIAARNLGRKAIGVEIEERYCELIARRLAQMTLDFGEPA